MLSTIFFFSLDSLNRLQSGIFFIVLGTLGVLFSKYLHKMYQNDGYKSFKSFRREGKTQQQDSMFVVMYWRTLGGIVVRYFVIICGIISIIYYFLE